MDHWSTIGSLSLSVILSISSFVFLSRAETSGNEVETAAIRREGETFEGQNDRFTGDILPFHQPQLDTAREGVSSDQLLPKSR